MDQFDQLIKEKAEKKEFKYKRLFWLMFAKSAGITAYSAIQIITGVVVITGVVGGATYFGVKNFQKNHPDKTPKNVIDTTSNITNPGPTNNTLQIDSLKVETNSITIEPEKPKVSTKKPDPVQKEQTLPVVKVIKDTIPPKKVYRDPYVGRRILTIDPDTILTNE